MEAASSQVPHVADGGTLDEVAAESAQSQVDSEAATTAGAESQGSLAAVCDAAAETAGAVAAVAVEAVEAVDTES